MNIAVYEDAFSLADPEVLQARDRKSRVDTADIEGVTTAGFYDPPGSGSHLGVK